MLDGTERYQHDFKRPFRPIRNHCHPVFVLINDSFVLLNFQLSIVLQKSFAGPIKILMLEKKFQLGFKRDTFRSPDLTMGVGIAATHELTLVFKNLNMVDKRKSAQFLILFPPNINNILQFVGGELRHGFPVIRGVADHAADTPFAAGDKEVFFCNREVFALRQECGEIVVENKNIFVLGSGKFARAFISGAKVAFLIISGTIKVLVRCCGLTLPWSVESVWTDEYPFAREGIIAAVGLRRNESHGLKNCSGIKVNLYCRLSRVNMPEKKYISPRQDFLPRGANFRCAGKFSDG